MPQIAGLTALANRQARRVDALLFAFLASLTGPRGCWHCRHLLGGLLFGQLHHIGQRERGWCRERGCDE